MRPASAGRGSVPMGRRPRRDQLERLADAAVGRGQHVVQPERLVVAAPPRERVVDVDRAAARRRGDEAVHDGVGQRLPGRPQDVVDPLAVELEVAQPGEQQLAVEEVADDHVVRRLAQRGRGHPLQVGGRRRQDGLAAAGGRDDAVGQPLAGVDLQHADASAVGAPDAAHGRAARGGVEVEQVHAPGVGGQAPQRQVVAVPGAADRDARSRRHVPLQELPERVARRRPAALALARRGGVADGVGARRRAISHGAAGRGRGSAAGTPRTGAAAPGASRSSRYVSSSVTLNERASRGSVRRGRRS